MWTMMMMKMMMFLRHIAQDNSNHTSVWLKSQSIAMPYLGCSCFSDWILDALSLSFFLFLSFFLPIPPIYSQKPMSPVPCFVSIRRTMIVSWSSRTPSTPAENQSSPLLKNQVSGQPTFSCCTHIVLNWSSFVPPPHSSSWLLFFTTRRPVQTSISN